MEQRDIVGIVGGHADLGPPDHRGRRGSSPRYRRRARPAALLRGAVPPTARPEDVYQALVSAIAAGAGVWWR